MFQKKEIELFGYEAIQVRNEDQSLQMTVIPNVGAHIQSLVIKGQELIDGFENEEEVKTIAWGKSALLYPFPNRLKDGKYQWLEKEYQFPINDNGTDNALHGFGMQRPLDIANVSLNEAEATIEMTGEYDGKKDYYPWPISIKLVYKLSAEDGFSMKMEIKNESKTPIPMGMGWHPYFRLGEKPEYAQLRLPDVAKVEIDRRMIPTGRLVAMEDFTAATTINGTQLDTGFKLFRPGKRSEAELIIPDEGKMTFWQESGHGKFKYLQVFIPPARKSIALEPMTCNIDAFNNGGGLAKLMPGKTLVASCGVNWQLAAV